MAIYLGSTLISSNPTGTGALYLGSLNICDAYLENTQVFDNCNQPNTSVVLTVVNAVSGGGETLVGDLTGATKSGQPGTSFTAFNTSVSLATYYSWASGPTFSGEVGGTFPATGSITRTTTVGGTTTYSPPPSTGTYSLQETGSAGPGVTFSVSPDTTPQTGTINTDDYSWDITATLGSQYNATDAISINGTTVISAGAVGPASGSFDVTGLITQSSDTILATYLGGSVLRTYTYSFSLTNSISNTTTSQSVSNLSSGASASGPSGGTITITGPEGSTWSMNGSATPNSGYEWSGGSRPSSADQTISGTMPANSSGSTAMTLTGSVILTTSTLTVSTYSGACANDACIYGSGSSTVYYTGSLPTSVFSDSGLTSPYSSGIFKISSGGALNVSSGIGSQESCISSLNTFNNIGNGGTSTSACSNASGSYDVYFGTGGFQTSSPLYSNNTGCTTAGSGFWSTGSQWIETNSSGVVINVGSC
jgi:hypothetical protein